jgi:hypothetical protein
MGVRVESSYSQGSGGVFFRVQVLLLYPFFCLDSSTLQVIFLSYLSIQLHSAFTLL